MVFARSLIFCITSFSTKGSPEKWINEVLQPLFSAWIAATGESIPPDKSVKIFPLLPTGNPPGPGIFFD